MSLGRVRSRSELIRKRTWASGCLCDTATRSLAESILKLRRVACVPAASVSFVRFKGTSSVCTHRHLVYRLIGRSARLASEGGCQSVPMHGVELGAVLGPVVDWECTLRGRTCRVLCGLICTRDLERSCVLIMQDRWLNGSSVATPGLK